VGRRDGATLPRAEHVVVLVLICSVAAPYSEAEEEEDDRDAVEREEEDRPILRAGDGDKGDSGDIVFGSLEKG